MGAADARRRVSELRSLLDDANHAYFVEADPIMPDSEYDQLMRELIELERAHPRLADPSSPSQRIGGAPIEGFATVEHAVPMQSIDNTYSVDDLEAWYERVRKGLGLPAEPEGDPVELVCDPKIDGVAVSLRYEQGALAGAVTRGDGVRGDEVTAQVRRIRSVPLRLRAVKGIATPEVLEARGEIFIPNSEFDRINAEREAAGDPPFANARNATAGTLKSLDPEVVSERKLRFIAHGRGAVAGLESIETDWDFRKAARRLGIPFNRLATRHGSLRESIEAITTFADTRGELDYGVDGMVVRLDRFDLQQRLGSTSKAPRWCIAFKYPAEQGVTILRRVDWQVGKNGTLTPRATMDPIFLAGTTVQHATLHNLSEIRRKDIRLGDSVVIEKAGEIIPQVVRAVTDRRRGDERPIEAPPRCPACDGVVEEEGPKLFCVNPECPAQFRERLKWFVGRGQMDVDGLGEKLVEQLVDEGRVSHFADLFALTREQLIDLERMGDKSTDNLLRAIDASRARGLARVVAGLGIRHIGTTLARTVARHFPDAAALQEASLETLTALPDFGTVTATTLHAYLQSAQGRDMFRRLERAGVDLSSGRYRDPARHGLESGPADAATFADRTFVLTGGLEHLTRAELTERLETLGARVSGSVSGRTDVVVAGTNPGSKLQKATELGIEVWDETRLLEELGLGERT